MLRSGSSVRTVRISSRYSVGAGISAGVSIAREASRRTCALAAPHAIPAPDHPTSPADRRPKRYRRHRHSSGRHSPNRSLVPRGRNLRTPPAPIRLPRNEHRPKTQTQHCPATSGRRLPPIRLPKRTLPENTEAAPIRSPPQKNAIIPAGTSSGRDDPHSERRRTASRDDGMSAVGPPSGKTALLPRQPSATLRIPSSQAGRPLRLQKRSH